jgi:hypothetical protein
MSFKGTKNTASYVCHPQKTAKTGLNNLKSGEGYLTLWVVVFGENG